MLQRQALRGRRILVIEDEWPLAAFIRDSLEDAGAVVIGLAGDCREAVNILDGTGVEAVILDLHLQGGTSHMLAHLLEMRGVPYLFATGYALDAAPISPGVMVLKKPFTDTDLLAAVETLFDGPTVGQHLKALS